MRFISFDCESHLIKAGLTAPRMVCLSWAERRGEVVDAISTGLLLRTDARSLVEEWLEDDLVTLIGHNVWYDLGLIANEWPHSLPKIFYKLEQGLVHDTMVRQQLIDIAEGQLKFHFDEDGDLVRSSYHLADLSYRLNKRFIKKGADTWRLKYALLDGIHIDQWPQDAKKYAIDDAEVTLEVWEAQQRIIETVTWTKEHPLTDKKTLMNAVEQHKASWILHLMSAWGLRTDGEAVAKLQAALEIEYATFMEKLRPSGLYNIAPPRTIKVGKRKGELVPEKVSKNMKAIYERVLACYGDATPRTEKGQVATDRRTLDKSGDAELKLIADAGFTSKLLSTYVPVLKRGTKVPINCRYNSPMETGRTSASGPNVQNLPRKSGARECFVPRPGWIYVFSDYDTLELRALAQVCLDLLGRSSMAEALRRGDDLHLSLAAQLLNIPVAEAKARYEAGDPVVKEYRQQAKVANFGFPGGLGADSFRAYAEGFKLIMNEEQARNLRETWFATWTEMRDYFDYITRLTERSDQLTQVRSGRVRGGASFCAAANGFFQGLAADGAKEALWRVANECYLIDPWGEGPTPLFGCRPVLFLHDEIGMEVPYKDAWSASQAADRLSEVMIEAMKTWIPGVPITCKPVMCRRWFKGAEAVRVRGGPMGGMLVPSRPVEDGEKTKWVADFPEEVLSPTPPPPAPAALDPVFASLLA